MAEAAAAFTLMHLSSPVDTAVVSSSGLQATQLTASLWPVNVCNTCRQCVTCSKQRVNRLAKCTCKVCRHSGLRVQTLRIAWCADTQEGGPHYIQHIRPCSVRCALHVHLNCQLNSRRAANGSSTHHTGVGNCSALLVNPRHHHDTLCIAPSAHLCCNQVRHIQKLQNRSRLRQLGLTVAHSPQPHIQHCSSHCPLEMCMTESKHHEVYNHMLPSTRGAHLASQRVPHNEPLVCTSPQQPPGVTREGHLVGRPTQPLRVHTHSAERLTRCQPATQETVYRAFLCKAEAALIMVDHNVQSAAWRRSLHSDTTRPTLSGGLPSPT